MSKCFICSFVFLLFFIIIFFVKISVDEGVKFLHFIFSSIALVCSLCLASKNKLNEEYEKNLKNINLYLFCFSIICIILSYFFYEYKGYSKKEIVEALINTFSSIFIMMSLFVLSAISKFKSKQIIIQGDQVLTNFLFRYCRSRWWRNLCCDCGVIDFKSPVRISRFIDFN